MLNVKLKITIPRNTPVKLKKIEISIIIGLEIELKKQMILNLLKMEKRQFLTN